MNKIICLILINTLVLTTSNAQVVISAEKSKKLYTGIQNELSIMINKCPCNLVVAKADHGELKESSPCRFIYLTDNSKDVIISVFKKWDKTKEPLSRFLFRTDSLPLLDASVGKYKGGLIKKETLANEREVFFQFQPEGVIICDVNSRVESFLFLILSGNKTIYTEENTNAFLTASEKDQVQKLKDGDRVLLVNIKGSLVHKKYNLKPLEFIIEE